MLKDEDSPPAKSDMCDVLKFQNKGGQIPNPFDLLKPIKEAMKNPLEFIFDFFQKIAGAFKSKPSGATGAKRGEGKGPAIGENIVGRAKELGGKIIKGDFKGAKDQLKNRAKELSNRMKS